MQLNLDVKHQMHDFDPDSICIAYGLRPMSPIEYSKVGIALETVGQRPINAMRHPPEGDTNGWYIWAGEERSNRLDFFKPLHIERIPEYLPEIEKYLVLPPGFRIQIDSFGYEDIWYEAGLLDV